MANSAEMPTSRLTYRNHITNGRQAQHDAAMVYKWEAHKEVCRRLYVDEKMSFRAIAAHMKEHHNFGASERALQCQFRRWGFPTRYRRFRKDEYLIEKVKELWQQNVSQKEMHRIINEEEGYEISERDLLRVRQKHNLMLRGRNGDRARQQKTPGEDDDVEETADGSALMPDPADSTQGATLQAPYPPAELFPTPEKLAPAGKGHNKPRRLTKALGNRPRDAAGPPRFPSELTLDEAKAILGLDDETYNGLKAIFTSLCQQAGVIKKTIAGPERWDALKDQLIRQFPPLEAELWQSRDNHDNKKLALDVICTDCTKRMRVKNSRLSLPDARVVLGINPDETRQLRTSFYQLVEQKGLHSKTQAGVKQWNDLKNEWASQSPIIQRILAPGTADPAHAEKLKALEILSRDVMKRRWDDALRAKKKQDSDSTSADVGSGTTARPPQSGARQTTEARFEVAPAMHHQTPRPGHHGAAAAAGPMYPAYQGQGSTQEPFTHAHHQQRVQFDMLMAATAPGGFSEPAVAPAPPSTSTAIFLRLHPTSTFVTNANLWIATLNGRSIRELRQVAVEKYPGAAVLRVEGILKDGKGGEMPLLIDGDSELEAYMAHLNGSTPTFSVQLVPGWRAG